MRTEDFHLIKKDLNALFHYPTLTLIEINDLVYEILSRLKSNETIESIALGTSLKQTDIETLMDNLSKAIPDFSLKKCSCKTDLASPSKKIGRITLHVANGCNLRCRYCYAGDGNYNLPESMMTPETASQFIDFCTSHFAKVETIVFFGGEPLLNPKIIKYICETFEDLYKIGKINYLPAFGIITNGTIINTEILNIVKKHIKFITVSIDGPQHLNDYNRKFKNGKGSYVKISNFINKIKAEAPNTHLKYEATYTAHHHQNKWSKSDVRSFLLKEFNLGGSIVPDISHQWDSKTNDIAEKESDFPEGFFGVLRALTHKIPKGMCPIGNDIVAISTDGEIYPCHLNNGIKHLSLGNMSSENIFSSRDNFLSKFPYLKSISQTEKPCVDCWANPICGGCPIYWFYDKENEHYSSLPKSSLCESNKKQLEEMLLLIIRLKKDNAKWTELLEQIKTADDND